MDKEIISKDKAEGSMVCAQPYICSMCLSPQQPCFTNDIEEVKYLICSENNRLASENQISGSEERLNFSCLILLT